MGEVVAEAGADEVTVFNARFSTISGAGGLSWNFGLRCFLPERGFSLLLSFEVASDSDKERRRLTGEEAGLFGGRPR